MSQPPRPNPLEHLPPLFAVPALEKLRQLDPGDQTGLMTRLLVAYETSLRELLQQLEIALTQRDWKSARRAVHTLRSSSGTVGALSFSEGCTRLEQALIQCEGGGPQPDASGVLAEGAALLNALSPWRQEAR